MTESSGHSTPAERPAGWKLDELATLVRIRFGEEQAKRASASAVSVAMRLDHVNFHLREIDDLLASKVMSESPANVVRHLVVKSSGWLNDLTLRYSAHALAAAQALHSVGDLLGSAIYLSLHAAPDWNGYLRAATEDAGEEIQLLVRALVKHPDYSYLAALVNQSKHRNLIQASFNFPLMAGGDTPRFEFEGFKRDKVHYPPRRVSNILLSEYLRQGDVVVRIGLELNRRLALAL